MSYYNKQFVITNTTSYKYTKQNKKCMRRTIFLPGGGAQEIFLQGGEVIFFYGITILHFTHKEMSHLIDAFFWFIFS